MDVYISKAARYVEISDDLSETALIATEMLQTPQLLRAKIAGRMVPGFASGSQC